MRLPKVRELLEALRIIFLEKRFTSKFPFTITPQHKNMRGFPELQDSCIGCGACANSCPAKAIEVIDNLKTGKRTLRYDYTRCILCGTCTARCSVKDGVLQKDKFDLASTDRSDICATKEFDLIQCEECCEPISSRDHLLWIARKAGTNAYNNMTLLKILHEANQLTDNIELSLADPDMRANIARYLCPEHKRNNLVRELWS